MAVSRRARRVVRKPRVQGASASRAASSEAIAQQTGIQAHAETDDLDRDIHLSRDQEYPSDELVHEETDWSPPSTLQAPPARPGFVQRWVRVEQRGVPDAKNLTRKLREGWQPRRPETVKGGFAAPTLNHGNLGSCISVEGMVLMEMPAKRDAQRNAHYAGKLNRQTEAIEAQLRASQDPRVPIDRRTQTTVTVGKRRPNVQEDEAA